MVLVLFILWIAKVGIKRYQEKQASLARVHNEAGRRITEFRQENMLVVTNTIFQQPKRRLYTWMSPDGQY